MLVKTQFDTKNMIFFYIIIFQAMISQGAYFVMGLLALNIFFMLYLLVTKKTLRIDINFILLIVIFILGIFSNIFLSINYYLGMTDIIKYMLFPLAYILFLNFEEKEKIHNVFYHSFILLMFFGVLGCLGLSLFPGMVIAGSNRMQSFLQYANTTALFMGIGVLLSIDKFLAFKKGIYIFLSLMFSIALFLTQSRITFVIFLFIVTLYLFRYLNKKMKFIFGLVILILLTVLLAIGERIVRISLFEPTLVERFITFYDASKILIMKPFGIGLGNWQYMQFQYQSAPYQVRYIHNFYLQMALDNGLLALTCFLGILSLSFYSAYRLKNINYYVFTFIILQSLFEVSFNFGVVIIYFAFVLSSLGKPLDLSKFVDFKLVINKNLKFLLILPCIFLVIFWYSEMLVSKGNRVAKYDKNRAYIFYTQAQKINPFNKDLLFKKAQLEKNPAVALNLLEQCYQSNPYHFQVMMSLAEGFLYAGNFEKSYFYSEKLVEIFPYNKKHQMLAKKVLDTFFQKSLISKETFNQLKGKFEETVSEKNKIIHPLYRYINPQMDYK